MQGAFRLRERHRLSSLRRRTLSQTDSDSSMYFSRSQDDPTYDLPRRQNHPSLFRQVSEPGYLQHQDSVPMHQINPIDEAENSDSDEQ